MRRLSCQTLGVMMNSLQVIYRLLIWGPLIYMPIVQATENMPRNEQLAAKLVGVWCASRDSGRSCFGHEEYKSDGTVRAWGTSATTGKLIESKGKYQVQGTTVCFNEIKISSEGAANPVGGFCSKYLYFDGKKYISLNLLTGKEDTAFKVRKKHNP